MSQLTRGAVEAIHKGTNVTSPVLQVMDVKKILGPNGQATTPERYRLMISDGEHFQQAMLATQLNDLVKDGGSPADRKLVPKCVIRLHEYICNTVHSRRIVIVLQCEVMGPPLSHVVGNPQNIEGTSTGTPGQDASGPTGTAAPFRTTTVSQGQQQQQQQQQHQVTSRSFGGRSAPSSFTGGSHSFATTTATLPEGVIPIKGLHPYQNRWTIKARITAKT